MATLRVLSVLGDTKIDWDLRMATAGDPEALAAVREAERIFAEQLARGATAFNVAAGKPAERLERFDPAAEQVVVVPRVAGG
jgi:hypothetical protein